MANAARQLDVSGPPQALLTFVSAVPPTRMCEFQMPTSPWAPAIFTWTMMAPGVISATEKRMS